MQQVSLPPLSATQLEHETGAGAFAVTAIVVSAAPVCTRGALVKDKQRRLTLSLPPHTRSYSHPIGRYLTFTGLDALVPRVIKL